VPALIANPHACEAATAIHVAVSKLLDIDRRASHGAFHLERLRGDRGVVDGALDELEDALELFSNALSGSEVQTLFDFGFVREALHGRLIANMDNGEAA
jgi:hypothetical protein